MLVVIEKSSGKIVLAATKDEAVKWINDRLKSRKITMSMEWREELGTDRASVVSPNSAGGTTTYFEVFMTAELPKTGDELRDFASKAYFENGPERDAIRDILKK